MNLEKTERFLAGDLEMVREIRSCIEVVVRKFGFPNRDLEDELVQEAIGRLFLSLAGGRFQGKSLLATYASNVAKYMCLEHLRRQRRAAQLAARTSRAKTHDMGPETVLLRVEQHRRYLCAFATLSGEERELLSMIFIRELSYRRVAAQLDITEGAVRVRVHRCRLKLRDELNARSPRRPSRKDPGLVSRWES